MNITLPYIDEKSGSGARARAAREGSAFIISCVSDAPFTNYHVNRGDARFIGSMVSSRLEATRVASFPISFERIEGGEEEGDAEEYWMDNADVKVSRRGNYFFSTTPQTSQRWIIMIDRMRRVKEFVQELYIYRVGYIYL